VTTPLEPRANPALLGHAYAETAFLESWRSGRVAHAWLLSGPKGVGKATLAFRIARFVLADRGEGGGLFQDEPGSLDLPAEHQVFRRVASGGHADLKVVERTYGDDKRTRLRNEIVVEDVRGIGAFLALTPAEGGWRVVIVDSADELNRHAANAVLKVLEEPPRNALLLLVSHSPGRLLPTIRSRCRRLPLRPLPEHTVSGLLGDGYPHIPAPDRLALARLGEGSVGKAMALAEAGGLDLYREIVGLFTVLPKLEIAALHTFVDRLSRPEADAAWRTVTELLGWWLARLVRSGGAAGRDLQEVVAGEGAVMQRLLAVAGLDRCLQVWEKVTALLSRAEAVNLDRKQALLSAFLAIERLARA
jgi:DNA polymerase-3 subunit delta'